MLKVRIHTDSRYPVNREVVKRAIFAVFKKNNADNLNGEVSVAIVGLRKMKWLCQKYKASGGLHEVLAFGFLNASTSGDENIAGSRGFINPPDGILYLGDIVICWPQVLVAAREDNVMVDHEIANLAGHGAEHLLGKHHE